MRIERARQKTHAYAISGLDIKIICVELFVAIASKFTHPWSGLVGSKVTQFAQIRQITHQKCAEMKKKYVLVDLRSALWLFAVFSMKNRSLFFRGSRNKRTSGLSVIIIKSEIAIRVCCFDSDRIRKFQKPHGCLLHLTKC